MLPGSWFSDLESADPARRFEAVRILLRLREGSEILRTGAMASPSDATRAWAVFIMARTDDSIDPVPFFSDPSAEVRYRAAEGAGLRGLGSDPAVREELQALLEDQDPMVRIAAAWAILKAVPLAGARDVLINGLSRYSRTFAAREAALRLVDLHGPLVEYDVARGYAHQDMARQLFAAKLAGLPFYTGIPAWFPAPDPPPIEAGQLERRLDEARNGAPAWDDLDELWRAAVVHPGRHRSIIAVRLAVLEFLLDRIQNEGALHADAALTYLNAGRSAEAQQHYRRAVALLPGDAALRNDFGISLEASGWDDEAETAYRESAAMDPTDEVPFLNLGHLLMKQGREKEAVQALLAAEKLAPDRWPYHRVILGRLFDGEAAISGGE